MQGVHLACCGELSALQGVPQMLKPKYRRLFFNAIPAFWNVFYLGMYPLQSR